MERFGMASNEKSGESVRYAMLHAGKAIDDFINHATLKHV